MPAPDPAASRADSFKYPFLSNIVQSIRDESHIQHPDGGISLPPLFSASLPVIDDPNFLIYLIPVPVFLALDCITRHEDIYDKLLPVTGAQLRSTHSYIAKKTVFVSHRWVGQSPDSADSFQFKYIASALMKFEENSRKSMYLWVDYTCMKQDVADIETIKRLNFILSFCEYFMVCLPLYDINGLGYIKRVWCVYEWLAVLHFKRILIMPSSIFTNQIMANSLGILEDVLNPFVFHVLESIRMQYWDPNIPTDFNVTMLFNIIQQIYIEDPIINQDEFVSKLEAYKEEDKAYVFKNISSVFSLLDCLWILVCGISAAVSIPDNRRDNITSQETNQPKPLQYMFSIPAIHINECLDNSIVIMEPLFGSRGGAVSTSNDSDDSTLGSLGLYDSSSSSGSDLDTYKEGDLNQGNGEETARLSIEDLDLED